MTAVRLPAVTFRPYWRRLSNYTYNVQRERPDEHNDPIPRRCAMSGPPSPASQLPVPVPAHRPQPRSPAAGLCATPSPQPRCVDKGRALAEYDADDSMTAAPSPSRFEDKGPGASPHEHELAVRVWLLSVISEIVAPLCNPIIAMRATCFFSCVLPGCSLALRVGRVRVLTMALYCG